MNGETHTVKQFVITVRLSIWNGPGHVWTCFPRYTFSLKSILKFYTDAFRNKYFLNIDLWFFLWCKFSHNWMPVVKIKLNKN